MNVEQLKLTVGKWRYPVNMLRDGGRLYFHFPFNRNLMAEIKAMQGSKFHGYDEPDRKAWCRKYLTSDKIWSISDSQRNWFQLKYMMGENVFAKYDAELDIGIKPNRDILRAHQMEMFFFGMTRKQCIFAAEMGTGKTLVAIEIIEHSCFEDWWYVAPRGVLKAIEREFKVWGITRRPRKMLTYEGLTKEMKNWASGQKAPGGVIFDESSRAKNPVAIRTQAAQSLADGIRADWGDNGFVILMSGSPAPKAPTDWWAQCEIACPGFLREGDIDKFKFRLGIFDEGQSAQGQKFFKRVAWRDDDNRCNKCGNFENSPAHNAELAVVSGEVYHPFVRSTNEVANLYKRLEGLVIVKFKKDCLDLPDKQYRIVECKPTKEILRAASSITNRTTSAAQTLILLRELSDGFQYVDEPDGESTCSVCEGSCFCTDFEINEGFEGTMEEASMAGQTHEVKAECFVCNGTGKVPRYVKETQEVECPKEDALRDLLDEHYDIGRLVVYGGFTGSINRCCRVAMAEGWDVVRADGRGFAMMNADGTVMYGDPLEIFQADFENHPRVCFIGQPGAAGMGLTLTASPSIVYYSNDFNAESRIQSEDRIHRLGMDVNRGATIYDLIHLPTDSLVLDNLRKKRKLQSMTMGEVQKALKEASLSDERLF